MNTVSALWAKLSSCLVPPSKRKSDKGAGFIEYAAIIIIIAAIAGLVYGSGIVSGIADSIGTNISDILETDPT